MKRISRGALAIAGFTAVGTAIGVSLSNGADRLVDAGYDRAIAVAAIAVGATAVGESAGTVPVETAYVRRVRHDVAPSPPVQSAATEHVWLTGSLLEPGTDHVADVSASPPAIIGTTVGARFSVASGGHAQTLEVVDVRPIADDQLPGAALGNGPARESGAKYLMVSSKVVAIDGKAPAPGARLVRFVVDANPLDAPTPARFPRVL
jgi:hypothetical protein